MGLPDAIITWIRKKDSGNCRKNAASETTEAAFGLSLGILGFPAEPVHADTQDPGQHQQFCITDMALIFLNAGYDQLGHIHAPQVYFPGQIFLAHGRFLHSTGKPHPITADISLNQKVLSHKTNPKISK